MAWLARDLNGDLYLYENKPQKDKYKWLPNKGDVILLTFDFDRIFLNNPIIWNDEPVEIEIKIKEEYYGLVSKR